MLDQILFALPARQLLRLLVELDADGAVDLLRFGGEGLYYVLCPRLVSGAPQAADALWSEGQLHSAVDPLEHARQLPLALDEHDAPYARRSACDPLRDPDDFHAAFPVTDPYAVIPGQNSSRTSPTSAITPSREKAPRTKAAASS